MPIVGAIFGGVDFSNMFIRLGPVPAGVSATDYAALKEAGVAMFGYGAFITATINFLILAWNIFLMVKAVNKVVRKGADAYAGTNEVELQAEIRDEQTKKQVEIRAETPTRHSKRGEETNYRGC